MQKNKFQKENSKKLFIFFLFKNFHIFVLPTILSFLYKPLNPRRRTHLGIWVSFEGKPNSKRLLFVVEFEFGRVLKMETLRMLYVMSVFALVMSLLLPSMNAQAPAPAPAPSSDGTFFLSLDLYITYRLGNPITWLRFVKVDLDRFRSFSHLIDLRSIECYRKRPI